MENSSWTDVERRALVDPLVHAALTIHHLEAMTREETLCRLVLALSDANAQWQAREVERLRAGAPIMRLT